MSNSGGHTIKKYMGSIIKSKLTYLSSAARQYCSGAHGAEAATTRRVQRVVVMGNLGVSTVTKQTGVST